MKYKILIADDEVANSTLIEMLLQLSKDEYDIVLANNGKEACLLAKEEKPDLILMDWKMPLLSGIDAVKILKSEEDTKYIPIIMQTCLTDSENLEMAFDAGVNDYIKKPIDKIELLSRVRSALMLYQSYKKIKEQNKIIEAQMEELQLLSIVARETANAVIIMNNAGDIEWVNESFKKIYEYPLNEFKEKYGKNIFEVSHNPLIKKAIEKLKSDQKSINYITKWKCKRGKSKWIQTTLTPVISETKEVKRFIAIDTDITRLKEIEEELKQKNENMLTLTEYLQELNKVHELEKEAIIEQRKQTESFLMGVKPKIIEELKSNPVANPRSYKAVTILITDFKNFNKSFETFPHKELISALKTYFSHFDEIISRHYVEKIKSVSDIYMCAGGLPIRNRSNAIDVVLAALEIQQFINNLNKFKQIERLPIWRIQLGIHTGSIIAGDISSQGEGFDIWGETLNIAQKMQEHGKEGLVNISGSTYHQIKEYFFCIYRGQIKIHEYERVEMYSVIGLKPKYSVKGKGEIPNTNFLKILNEI